MGLKNFRITFDNQWSTYYPGQTVTGNVIVVVDSMKKIRGISLKVKGEANTCWTTVKEEIDDKRSGYQDEIATGHEEYFEMKFYLIGSASSEEIEIQSGEHKFPFTCSLPMNLPSSFESEFGYVRYTIKATLDRPWKFDQDVKTLFTVIAPLDLNQDSRAAEPIQQEMSKTFCCLCCGTPSLTVNYSLPVRGYVPGQSMPIKINVENLSNVVVKVIKLMLCKIVTFHATTPRLDKTEEFIVTEVSKGPIEANGTVDYEQQLDIPPVPPSNLANCGIIDLEYNLKVEACVEGWYHRNLSTKTLILVGTVPLSVYHTPSAPPAGMDGDYTEQKPPEVGFVIPSANTALPPLPKCNLYPNLPPPSFEESSYGAKDLRENGESEYVYGLTNHFAPRYPVYNFASAQ